MREYVCLCVYVCQCVNSHAAYALEVRRVFWAPGTGIISSCGPLSGQWEPYPGPPQEQ